MHIERSKPFARGVTELQYVGDAEPARPPTAAKPSALVDLAPSAALAIVALKTKGVTRLAAAAGAAYLALRYAGRGGLAV